MQTSDLPARFKIPFANGAGSGYIRTIPDAHQTATSTDAPASFTDGFPPETFVPQASGGVPPSGADFNGILSMISKWSRWQAAGGPAIYDSAFSTAVGGYPKGAKLDSTVTPGLVWISTADNNTTDPDGGSPANWLKMTTPGGWNASLTTNGYQVFPSGFMLQWGINRSFHSGEGGVYQPFATPFPTACFAVIATEYVINPSDTGNDMWAHVSSRTASGFYYNYGASSGGNSGEGFDFLAIGA